MNLFSRILFPVAVTAFAAAGALDFGNSPFRGIPGQARNEEVVAAPDTVIYPRGGYKLRRTLSLEEITVRDTTSAEPEDSTAPDSWTLMWAVSAASTPW